MVARVSHFGSNNESAGLELALRAKITGPIVASGGWFVRYVEGAAKKLNFTAFQIAPTEPLILAFPYPAGTTFNIYYFGGYCGACTHASRPVNSIQEVVQAFGDAHYWDNNARTLYVRIVHINSQLEGGGNGAAWTSYTFPLNYTRNGMSLLQLNEEPYFIIDSSCTTDPCPYQEGVVIPAAIGTPTQQSPLQHQNQQQNQPLHQLQN